MTQGMADQRPGATVDRAPFISELDFSQFRMRVSTERYTCPQYHARERERLWMRCWQPAGRADELPEPGDWKVHQLFDQSYILVRGKDGVIRGFVNACRHRGNALCEGRGRSARFNCPYHNWAYGLDGELLAVARPDFNGTIAEFVGPKEELGLFAVSVECFGGFIFLNPDPGAQPLHEYLGEMVGLLEPYRMEDMVPVGINVREALDCNWKVVIDAFQEGYHVQGIHPELVKAMDESKERYRFCGDHSVATAPFGAANIADHGPDQQVEAIHYLPATFPGVTEVLPRFDQLVDACRDAAGQIRFPEGVNGRTLLQQATREVLTAKGLDVSGLTDNQLSDNQFYVLFPNFFMTIRAGEATVILAEPHPDGDPNRCIWHVYGLMWLPPGDRAAMREPLREVAPGEHVPYFLALEQDYVQMHRQQRGLRNRAPGFSTLTKQEVRLAHFHAAVDAWVKGP